MEIAAGTRLGPYEITGLIGAGGMGEVYRARDTRLGRDVAIKVIPARLAADPRLRDRLVREARAISSLAHPHICTLFDIGQQDGIEYLVMEFLDGQTLADAIARGPLPLDQLIRYGSQIADAIGAAHRQGIVHRDLKPGNVMLTKSGVKVLDFGLATSHSDATTAADATEQKPLTEAGAVVGTLQYMAPEQLRGADADVRSDIFALGTILYEMATGRRAFEGKTRTSVVASILEAEPPPMATLQPMTPPALDHLVRKCLEKDPDERLQSASDLAFALREITQPENIVPARERRAWIAIAAVIALLIGGVAASWIIARRRAPAAEATAPKTIAVLPFANLGLDRSRSYLLLAIPDEITTILTYSTDLAVRPFSASRRLSGDIDPQEAAKKLNAGAVVSGHLTDASGRLNVTLEAIDIAKDKLLWHDVFEVPSADLITMRSELSQRIRRGLLPRLSGGGAVQEGSGPKNAEAYALYLRAAAASADPQPNKEALQLLESVVRDDPSYAPAWAALSLRVYYDYAYGDGGEAALRRSEEAATRALQIDPDLAPAATQQIVIRTERGHTIDALRDAKQHLARRPGSAEAHFDLSYVMRYGGALDESAAECNKAIAIDPGSRGLRSCASTFLSLGDFNRALDFAALDPGSEFSKRIISGALARQGKYDEMINVMHSGANPVRDLMVAWRSGKAEEADRAAARLMQFQMGRQDGEPYYAIAGFLSVAGRPSQAIILLREAVRRNFCTVPAIDRDPEYAAVRALPEFAAFHDEGAQCHERFMAALQK